MNIAEGNGRRSLKDRSRYFEIARGSALECAATQDVLAGSGGIQMVASQPGKEKRQTIVSRLTKLVQRAAWVAMATGTRAAGLREADGG